MWPMNDFEEPIGHDEQYGPAEDSEGGRDARPADSEAGSTRGIVELEDWDW